MFTVSYKISLLISCGGASLPSMDDIDDLYHQIPLHLWLLMKLKPLVLFTCDTNRLSRAARS